MTSKDNSRRKFIRQNSIAGIGLLTTAGNGYNMINSDKTDHDTGTTLINAIGQFSLEDLRNDYNTFLFDRFIPNMDKLVIDHEFGGFMCNVDIAGWKVLSTDKKAWFEGRGIWIYSFLYNKFKKDPRFLEIARKSIDLVMTLRPVDDSFWVSSFDRQGKPADSVGARYGNQFGLPTSAKGDLYGNMFIAEGLVEYALASGEEQYHDIAKKIILGCMAKYDEADYAYHVNYLDPEISNGPGSRVLGHWMIFLRSVSQMLEIKPDAELESIAQRCVNAIINHHLNPHYGLLNEVLNHDFSRPVNEFANFAYLGHGIETLWMVMAEAIRKNDAALFHKTTEIFKRHVTVATDDVYGGYFRSLDHVDNNTWKVDKVLWLHEEILIGCMMLIEHTGDIWAQQCFAKTFNYIQQKFIRSGYAFWIPGGDRQLTEHQTGRAEHYHHPRHLMLNLLSLNRILERKGKTSGIFD